MSHFALLWKARTIEKYRQNYENEKINSIIMSNTEVPEKTLFQKWRHYSHNVQNRLSRKFSKWYPEGTTVSNFFVHFRSDMKLPHILTRSLFGFLGGLLLTYLGFMFFVFQLSLSIMHATILSSIIGVLLTLGLTFSNRMRCIIFLLIPQLFSRVGRYTITCYALVLILTGPATNTLKNSEVLSESMACSQEQIKMGVKEINESIKNPINSIRTTLKAIIKTMKVPIRQLKTSLISINRLILSIASIIQSEYSWLETVVKSCNRQLGSPYDRCLKIMKAHSLSNDQLKADKPQNKGDTHRPDVPRADRHFAARKHLSTIVINKAKNSNEKLKKNVKHPCRSSKPWFCNAGYVAKVVCDAIKPYQRFCEMGEFAEKTFLATVKKKIKTFTQCLSAILHVQLKVQHSYKCAGNSSSGGAVAAGIITEIRKRADPIITWLSWSSCVTSLFLLLIIFRAKHYQHMFETRSRFDNRFITKEFREFDLKRLRERRETVLPLNRRERAKYVTTTSFRLVASEKLYLNRSVVFTTITSFKLMIHIVADYSLYWVLTTIKYHGERQTPLESEIPDSGVHISGQGYVARLLQSFIDALNTPFLQQAPKQNCLPSPHTPDFKRYGQIGFLIFLLWILALFEPYGLRLRHLIVGHYKPDRAKARAIWLYNHILRTRGSFMKFARRKLHREYKYSTESKLTFHHWLKNHVPFSWLRYLLRIDPELPRCLLCKVTEDPADSNAVLTKCEVRNCPGTYCASCFSDLGQFCTICLSPADYGDISDVSLEEGSSDDDDCDDNRGTFSFENNNGGGSNISNKEKDNTFTGLRKYNSRDHSSGSKATKTKLDKALPETEKESDTFPLLQRCNTVISNKRELLIESYSINLLNIILVKRNFANNLYFSKKKSLKIRILKDENYLEFRCLEHLTSVDSFSVYKINIINPFVIVRAEKTTQLARYLRKKKIVRCKKRYFKDNYLGNHSTFKHCNNKGENSPKNRKGGQGAQNENKRAGLTGNRFKITDDQTKNTTSDVKNVNVGKSSLYLGKFCKYWNNMKLTVLPCIMVTNRELDLPPKKRDHRKKKKRKKSHSVHRAKKQNEDSRNTRILAFLNDRDWVSKDDVHAIAINNRNIMQDNEIKNENAGEIEVGNNIKIPRLNLNISSDSTSELNINLSPESKSDATGNTVRCNIHKVAQRSTGISNSAFDRFFKSIIICDSSKDSNKISEKKTYIAQNKKTKMENQCIKNKNNDKKRLNDVKSSEDGTLSLSPKGLKRSLSLIKDIYSSIFIRGSKDETLKCRYVSKNKETDDKAVTARPHVNSCACQKHLHNAQTFDVSTQIAVRVSPVTKMVPTKFHNAQVNAVYPTCTCATQYRIRTDDIGTCVCEKHGTEESSESDLSKYSESSPISSSETPSTIKSDDTKTTTTVCSLPSVDNQYEKKRYKKHGKVVTKSNQSTLTDRAQLCSVSTSTYDWWSPIIEKKDVRKKERRYEEKKRKEYKTPKEKEWKVMRNRGMSTTPIEKMVHFRSKAQIIPNTDILYDDVLSPSRYLLESQKYYNELYYTPLLFPVSYAQKYLNLNNIRSHASCRQRGRRGRRTKRLEERCSPSKHSTSKRKITD